MGTTILILLLALVLGGVGLMVKALWWMLIIAGALALYGLMTGYRYRVGRRY
jgi:hypothetical protein